MDMLLEVVFVPVSDVERSKQFYEQKAGFKVDFQFGENGQPDGNTWTLQESYARNNQKTKK